MSNYVIEKKARSGGKTEVKILLDGVEIGKRTSARPYRFALVVKRNQAHELKRAQESLAYSRKEEAKYRAVVNDEPGARERFITHDSSGKIASAQSQTWHREWIASGEVAKWATGKAEEISRLEALITRLSSGPQPEYDKAFVASWHHARHNVPAIKDYQVFVAVIEIPE